MNTKLIKKLRDYNNVTMADAVDAASAIETLQARIAYLEKPDMFWNDEDPEKPYDSISELLNDAICKGSPLTVGYELTIQQASKHENISIRVTSIDDEECDASYEIIKPVQENHSSEETNTSRTLQQQACNALQAKIAELEPVKTFTYLWPNNNYHPDHSTLADKCNMYEYGKACAKAALEEAAKMCSEDSARAREGGSLNLGQEWALKSATEAINKLKEGL